MELATLKPADIAQLTHGQVLGLLMTAMPYLKVLQLEPLMEAGKELGPSWKTDVTLRRTCYGGEADAGRKWEAQVCDVWGHMHTRAFYSAEADDALRRAVLDAWCMVNKYDEPGWVYVDDDGAERETA